MMTLDNELMDEIRKAGDIALDAQPQLLDSLAVATKLGAMFEHRSVEEIQQKVRDHFQARGLFLADV